MKIIGLTIFLSFLLSSYSAFGSVKGIEFELGDEEYVNDIPFKTHAIVSSLNNNFDTLLSNEKDNSEDTGNMCSNAIYLSASVEFNLDEEEYIDDIPFDTQEVFNSMVNFNENDKNVIVQDFYLADEDYVDDIPFDTRQLIADRLSYPEFAREAGLEGIVSVSCKYDEEGYLKVVGCNCSNILLRDYVVSVIEDIRLRSGIVSLDKEYVLKFNFRSI